jgi:hypothetical protein
MTAGLFATLAMTHVGPLTENPVSARADLLVHRGQAAFEVRPQLGDLRGELLEQLHGLAGRDVAGDERVDRQVLRRAAGAGVGQPRSHSRSRSLECERDFVLFCTRRSTLLEEHVLHPHHPGELDGRRVVSGRLLDDRGRIDRDEPAHAAPVPLADGRRKRRAVALSHVRESPRQIRPRV